MPSARAPSAYNRRRPQRARCTEADPLHPDVGAGLAAPGAEERLAHRDLERELAPCGSSRCCNSRRGAAGRALLQETKVSDEQFPRDEIEAAGYRAVFSGQKTYNGVAMLARGELAT